MMCGRGEAWTAASQLFRGAHLPSKGSSREAESRAGASVPAGWGQDPELAAQDNTEA